MKNNLFTLKKSALSLFTAITLCLCCLSIAYADPISLTMTAQEEIVRVNAEGEKVIEYIEAESVIPNDILLYTITYENVGQETAENLVINNPIPADMKYLADSAAGEDTIIRFSIDNGNSFDFPGNLFITLDDGSKRQALAGEYTNIQWRLDKSLPVKASGKVTYRAQLK